MILDDSKFQLFLFTLKELTVHIIINRRCFVKTGFVRYFTSQKTYWSPLVVLLCDSFFIIDRWKEIKCNLSIRSKQSECGWMRLKVNKFTIRDRPLLRKSLEYLTSRWEMAAASASITYKKCNIYLAWSETWSVGSYVTVQRSALILHCTLTL